MPKQNPLTTTGRTSVSGNLRKNQAAVELDKISKLHPECKHTNSPTVQGPIGSFEQFTQPFYPPPLLNGSADNSSVSKAVGYLTERFLLILIRRFNAETRHGDRVRHALRHFGWWQVQPQAQGLLSSTLDRRHVQLSAMILCNLFEADITKPAQFWPHVARQSDHHLASGKMRMMGRL